ncbi:MAG: redox-sensing transcriptional repressor Rex [Planctomycetota bacterium]
MALNRKCIIRISRYKNALNRLKALGFVKVFSGNLADAAGVSSSQVRKDFSLFGITGNRRGGYKVDELIERIRAILGKNELQKVIIVGAGNIGKALLHYKGFETGGIKVMAAFDIDPGKYSQELEIPVLPLEDLRGFVQEHEVKIGILAVTEIAAHHVSEIMISAGINAADDVVINNINLEVELENLIYFVNAQAKTDGVFE